jgi:single-strand DNA-binding protein
MAVLPKEAQEAQEAQQPDKPQAERKKLGPGSLAGNLTADPTLRYTQSGRPVTTLRVAVTPRKQNAKTGEWEDGQPQFFDVSAWGQLAEHCAEHLSRGQRIVAEGEWESRSWEGNDGTTQESVALIARDLGPSMLFLGARVVKTERRRP